MPSQTHRPAPPWVLPLGRQRAKGREDGGWLKQKQSPWDQEYLNKGRSRRDRAVADQEALKDKGKTGLPGGLCSSWKTGSGGQGDRGTRASHKVYS